MTGVKDIAGIEIMDGPTRKVLTVSPIRLGTHASLSLTFDRRYRRSITLTRSQLVAHAHECLDVADTLPRETQP